MANQQAEFEALLAQTLVPNTDVVKAAEENLKAVIKDPQSVEALLTQVTQSQNPAVRTVAAVQLRKSIAKHWADLPPEARTTIKSVLLERVANETQNNVRKNVASVVSMVAKKALPAEGWPELLGFLQQCTSSGSADHREVGLMVFERLADMAGEHFKPWLQNLQEIFTAALGDPELRVRVAGLRAACQLVQWISDEKEVLSFQALIPPMAAVMGQCLEAGDEQNACRAFGVFFELIQSPVPVLTPHLPDLLSFSLQVASSKPLAHGTREAAVELVTTIAESKPKFLRGEGVAPAVISTLFGMIVEPEEKEEGDDDKNTPSSIALVALDTLACRLPSKLIFGPTMATAAQLSNSPDPCCRRGALMSVGIAAEGCADAVREQLTELVAFIANAASDADPKVRDAACFAVREFSEHLQPDICQHHATLLPAVFKCLDDAGEEVKEKAGYALESFAENLEKEILPYLAPLMAKLVELLLHGTRKVQETATAAISSTAAAVIFAASSGDVEQEVFHPYVEQILPVFKQIMTATTEDMFVLRARATECLGILVQCYEKEQAAQMIGELMPLVFAGLSDIDSSEVREFTYGFFANAAEVMEEGFAPYLDAAMKPVFISLQQQDIMWDDDGSEDEIQGGADGQPLTIDLGSDDSDGGEGEIFGGARGFSVRTALLDEKASACQCVGNLAEHTGTAFAPYIEQSLKFMSELSDYFHEEIRGAVRSSMGRLVLATSRSFGAPAMDGSLHPTMQTVLTLTWEVHQEAFVQEPDPRVVAMSCGGIANMLGWGGRQLLQPEAEIVPMLCRELTKLLNKKSLCQTGPYGGDSDDEGDGDDDADHDEALIDSVTECVTSIAKCYGPDFGDYLPGFLQAFTGYCREHRPPLDRSMGIGAVAELVQTAGAAAKSMPGVVAQLQDLVGVTLSCLADHHEEVRRNAAYAIGVLCLHLAEALDSAVPSVLVALQPMLARGGAVADATVDNAGGALARIVVSRLGEMQDKAGSLAPLPWAEIVPALMSTVPIKEDFAENVMVTEALLIVASHPETAELCRPHSVALAGGMCGAVAAGKVEGDAPREGALPLELHAKAVGLLRTLTADATCAAAVQEAMAQLVPDARQELQSALQ